MFFNRLVKLRLNFCHTISSISKSILKCLISRDLLSIYLCVSWLGSFTNNLHNEVPLWFFFKISSSKFQRIKKGICASKFNMITRFIFSNTMNYCSKNIIWLLDKNICFLKEKKRWKISINKKNYTLKLLISTILEIDLQYLDRCNQLILK